MKIFICLLLFIFTWFLAHAQNSSNKFLSDLSIKDIVLGSKLTDITANKKISNNLSVYPEIDSISFGTLKNQNINFYNLERVDQLYFFFKNNTLHDVIIEFLKDPSEGGFEKTLDLFKTKFGKPDVTSTKFKPLKLYVWKDGENKLMLKPLKYSYIVKYYSTSSYKKQH